MNKVISIGAWYSDCDLNRNTGSLFSRSRVEINSHNISLPGANEDVLYLRYYAGLVAGQGNPSGNCYLWDSRQWRNYGSTFGVSPVCFYGTRLYIVIAIDKLKIVDLTTFEVVDTVGYYIGTQGIRYIDAEGIHTGDQTYQGPVAEYSKLGNVTIGQGYNGGAIAIIYDGDRELYRGVIEPGDCKWIRAYRSGTTFAVAIVKQTEGKAVFVEFEYTEIFLFPPETNVPPEPEPPMPLPPIINHQADLERIKSQLLAAGQDLTGTNGGKIVRQFCWEYRAEGWYLLKKTGGTNFQGCSVDYVIFKDGRSGDVIVDAGGANGINWNISSEPQNSQNDMVPVTSDPGYYSGGTPTPIPPEPNPNPPVDPCIPITDIDTWLFKESPEIIRVYKERHGSDISYENLCYQAYRRLANRVPFDEVLASV